MSEDPPSDGVTSISEPRGKRVERSTLGRQIADAIRRDILFGRIAPGTKLGQQQLCEEFGTSRMPVRDALRQLTYSGFLTTDEGHHSIVAKLSRQDLTDIYVVEGMLHGLAARRVAESASDEELARLEQLDRAMREAEEAGDAIRMAELNWRFHRLINQQARSRKLIAALRTLALSIPRDYVVQFPEWMHRSNVEHGEILKAMRERKGDVVEELIRRHVADAGEDLTRYLERQGVDLSD